MEQQDKNVAQWARGKNTDDPLSHVMDAEEAVKSFQETSDILTEQGQILSTALSKHVQSLSDSFTEKMNSTTQSASEVIRAFGTKPNGKDIQTHYADYITDAMQRSVLTLDTLRERGNIAQEHSAAGSPPVLIYDYEIVVDGHDLETPSNYVLLHIIPPEGVTTYNWKRPYMIIDPRAGHGPGIGGFKADSQVGVALRDGHPVYFVAFRPDPVPGQTLADVTASEAAFVKAIAKRHPEAPKPIVVGNCQGGWASLLLAATNPDLTGPVVLNGAPVVPWSGEVGSNPMRYNGGLLGGVVPAMFMADLGNGVFDGANLVMNFEQLNPARTQFRKYYDLYSTVDNGRERFLEFEKWWSSFYLMNEAEIRWIVEQIFVGNKLARGEARLQRGRVVDPKRITSPIIVFASHGDNITPPQQALNWIVDTYADESEIKIRGQRIIYMVHDQVGHLGIFVSSSIAKKEHTEMASTMKTIEALPPGLYEMSLESISGEGYDKTFTVSFNERTMEDLLALDDGRQDEHSFAAVARISELNSEIYDLYMRPFVKSMVTPQSAELMKKLHPMRSQRTMLSDQNPALYWVKGAAEQVTKDRRVAAKDNPFVMAERLMVDMIENSINMYVGMRDAMYEMAFFGIYASPLMRAVGASHDFERTRKNTEELRQLPEVRLVLLGVGKGGFEEAVVRMLLFLAESRGSVRRSRLERSAHVLTHDEPFKSLGAEKRAKIIHEQKIIVQFEPDDAIDALPLLLEEEKERQEAIDVVEYIAGPIEEMEPATFAALQRFRVTLGLDEHTPSPSVHDPLAHETDPYGDEEDSIAGVKPTLLETPEGDADELTALRGLGTKIAERMNGIGIYHLSQIASWSEEEAAWVDNKLGLNGRVKREGWVDQARNRVAPPSKAAE